jgi:hypothetical protein
MAEATSTVTDVGVVIVGGGGMSQLCDNLVIILALLTLSSGCGLTLSCLLSQFGVDHILF